MYNVKLFFFFTGDAMYGVSTRGLQVALVFEDLEEDI